VTSALLLLLWVDPTAGAEERQWATDGVEAAREHVRSVFGSLQSPEPEIFLCQSDACAARYTGPTRLPRALMPRTSAPGARFVAGDRPAIVVPRFGTRVRNLLSHEWVHVELRARRGAERLPTWFNEGLAASVGDQPPCAPGLGKGVDSLSAIATPRAYEEHIVKHPELGLETYCQARAAVERWAGTDGRGKLAQLLQRLAAGDDFEHAAGETHWN
jgi:hypothetical protein